MQRKSILAVLAAASLLWGCATRDPNLAVHGLNELKHAPGDYTLALTVYQLDADGKAVVVGRDDAGFRNFVVRTLAPKGYLLKASGPARYAVEAHLLCGNMRTASKNIVGEALGIPAQAVGPAHSAAVHYWLPGAGSGNHELRDPDYPRRLGASSTWSPRSVQSGTAVSGQSPDPCQGRVLLAVTPAPNPNGGDGKRDVYVTRSATDDCRASAGCPVNACRQALEQSLVEALERGF